MKFIRAVIASHLPRSETLGLGTERRVFILDVPSYKFEILNIGKTQLLINSLLYIIY